MKIERYNPIIRFIIGLFLYLLLYSAASSIFDVAMGGNLSYSAMVFKRATHLIVAIALIVFLHTRSSVVFDYYKLPKMKPLLIVLVALFVFIVVYENTIDVWIKGNSSSTSDEIISLFRYPIAMFIQTCITAPFLEETLVRGYLYKTISNRLSPAMSLVICNLLFSLLHFNLSNIIFYFAIGCIFSLSYLKTGNLSYALIGHLLINIVSFVSYYI